MGGGSYIDGKPDHEALLEVYRWVHGNGSRGAEARLRYLEDNFVKTSQIPEVVRNVMKVSRQEERKDWNRWVNTGMLVVMIIGQIIVVYTVWGG